MEHEEEQLSSNSTGNHQVLQENSYNNSGCRVDENNGMLFEEKKAVLVSSSQTRQNLVGEYQSSNKENSIMSPFQANSEAQNENSNIVTQNGGDFSKQRFDHHHNTTNGGLGMSTSLNK